MAAGDEPRPRIVTTSRAYERDAKKVRSRGKEMDRLVAIIDALRNRQPLAPRHRDHALVGNWQGYRECQIQADWLLIYRVDNDSVHLARTGTHSDLFR